MTFFTCFYLDSEKDIVVDLYKDLDRMWYRLSTPNHHTGNLIRNLAKLCQLPLSQGDDGLLVINGEVPCYIDADNKEVYIFRLKGTKVANIYPDGRVEMKASIPAISKTLMSQTHDYRLDVGKTIFKTYIRRENKFRSDLHTHMNGNLPPDLLIALGIYHQIRYPLYYVKKLNLTLTKAQSERLAGIREKVARQVTDPDLKGKYLDRRIDDNTFINFADLILNNIDNAAENIARIRNSLAVLKDGQAVFTNLEKVYLYRYIFTKGQESEDKIPLRGIGQIPDRDIRRYLEQMLKDKETQAYHNNTIFQDDLLWIARCYRSKGIDYVEISDTTLVKKYESIEMLSQVHQVMPYIYQETQVMIRFLAALRRIPLTIVKSQVTPSDYLTQNLKVLQAESIDPYVAGCDFVGEEINDIIVLKPLFKEIVKITKEVPGFTIRIHAGENDSQKDNIGHSIECVVDSLEEGQPMPKVRLGHGLYMHSFRSEKGSKVLEEIKKYGIVLEFQLTSNVRLNNLNGLDNHPLRKYLKEGIGCVQGTDGGAIYGTNSIDEQLALEKLLDLTDADIAKMKATETTIIKEAQEDYRRKGIVLKQKLRTHTLEEVLLDRMENGPIARQLHLGRELDKRKSRRYDANTELKSKIRQLPWDRTPVVLVGGSFNTDKRSTRITPEACRKIDSLLERLDPEEVFFMVGQTLTGYEEYLVAHNSRHFTIFAMVPALLTAAEKERLLDQDVYVRVSIEAESMGIYKSFNYEVFERRPSILLAFDGNSAGANLIQEARNGKGRSSIFIWDKCSPLKKKAQSLSGYVTLFGKDTDLADLVLKALPATKPQG